MIMKVMLMMLSIMKVMLCLTSVIRILTKAINNIIITIIMTTITIRAIPRPEGQAPGRKGKPPAGRASPRLEGQAPD